MKVSSFIYSVLMLSMTVGYLEANIRPQGFATRKADRIASKRFEKKTWGQSEKNSLTQKTFPLKSWSKHFSSVGSKRSPIALTEGKEKQMFRTKTKIFGKKEMSFEMSRLNDKVRELHKTAGIDMDDKARLFADRRLYSMLMDDSQRFSDMGKQVSLRDLNRYQFRRNRSNDSIPVDKAGSGK